MHKPKGLLETIGGFFGRMLYSPEYTNSAVAEPTHIVTDENYTRGICGEFPPTEVPGIRLRLIGPEELRTSKYGNVSICPRCLEKIN